MIEELDRLRGRMVAAESADINLEQKIHDLFTSTKIQDTQLSNLEKWSNRMQEKQDGESLELSKVKDI